jgi:hypothetical protein
MPKMFSITKQMIDIIEPEQECEVTLKDGSLWVNVDGVCRLRVKGIRKEVLSIYYRPKEWT